jgi:hypothetical protein
MSHHTSDIEDACDNLYTTVGSLNALPSMLRHAPTVARIVEPSMPRLGGRVVQLAQEMRLDRSDVMCRDVFGKTTVGAARVLSLH